MNNPNGDFKGEENEVGILSHESSLEVGEEMQRKLGKPNCHPARNFAFDISDACTIKTILPV